MMVRMLLAFICFLVSCLSTFAKVSADTDSIPYPHVWLKNSQMQVLVFVPDKGNGYYRSTRFDWSGIVAHVYYKGHTFFRPWEHSISRTYPLSAHDPNEINDGAGTAEEFRLPLGYDEAQPSEGFVKIGVGVLEKPDNQPYDFKRKYQFVEVADWQVSYTDLSINFSQNLYTLEGYGYNYSKTIILNKNKPEFLITHTLHNTGINIIKTGNYCHNFILMNNIPLGVDYEMRFVEKVVPENKDNFFTFSKRKIAPVMEMPFNYDFGLKLLKNKFNYVVKIRNSQSKTGMCLTGNYKASSFYCWFSATAICPEPMIDILLHPGESISWSNRYKFKVLKST